MELNYQRAYTQEAVALFSPELKTFKKVTDDPKILEELQGNEALDKKRT